MWGISYWVSPCPFYLSVYLQKQVVLISAVQIFPVISGLSWLCTLLGLLIYWNVTGHPHYVSMPVYQTIPYISDVGAQGLKPFFIAGCCITTIFLDISFLSGRWLRHLGRLAENTTKQEKVVSALSMAFAVIGTAGLILLSIFDTWRHSAIHKASLILFIIGYITSAVFICWEYQRLGVRTSPPIRSFSASTSLFI